MGLFGLSKSDKQWIQSVVTQAAQQIIAKENEIMADIAQIQADLAAQKTKLEALVAAFEALKNNTNPGPGPGQVIVNQADLDAIDAAITGETAEMPTV